MSQPPVPGHHREEFRSPTSAPRTTAPVLHSFTSCATLAPDPHPRLRRLLHIPYGMMNTGIHEYMEERQRDQPRFSDPTRVEPLRRKRQESASDQAGECGVQKVGARITPPAASIRAAGRLDEIDRQPRQLADQSPPRPAVPAAQGSDAAAPGCSAQRTRSGPARGGARP
jgi:hypothetical protein